MNMHGRDKTGAFRDDEAKRRTQGELKANRALRAEESRDPEPSGEDQPDVDRAPDTTLVGGTAPGMTSEDVELRTELAQHLGRVYPAGRAAVLDTLRRNHAPDRLLDLAADLPEDQVYANVQDIVLALGLSTEEGRG